ncbi:DNA repair protein RecN [Eionea flava]
MLTHITINNFTLVEHLDLDLRSGMTAITGETGTGKSILLDALAMTLGERADAERVRYGSERADITATFSLNDLHDAKQWLINNDLSVEDECLLRRVITAEGRSRCFINAQPVTLQQVRALGEHLIDIHSQHAHQSLLSKQTHLRLLDEFAQHQNLADTVKLAYKTWQTLHAKWITHRDNADETRARYQLLRYQVDELDQLDLSDGELPLLEAEQQTLESAESIIQKSLQLAEYCDHEEHGLQANLSQALRLLGDIKPKSKTLTNAEQLLSNALIHVEEAHAEIRHQVDSTTINPERLNEVSERLSACYEIARKHHVAPEALPQTHLSLAEELDSLSGGDDALTQLADDAEKAKTTFLKHAKKLSAQRQKAAKQLTQQVNQQLATLAMANADFIVAVTSNEDNAAPQGIDQLEFMISTNPGQPHKPLSKVASGGELSRVSLAIQVARAQASHIATLVFDEVDVGIGGATADVVGQLLANLGKRSQVLCVTHLAQVASKGHQHWRVSKSSTNDQHKKSAAKTSSTIIALNEEEKIKEIARMMSGSDVSEQSLAHAKVMLEGA